MGKHYKKPPLLEAVCEFRFQPEARWDQKIPDLIYEKVQAQFLERREEKFPTLQFRRSDGAALLQAAPNLLAVNQLKPYPTWPQFKQMILEAYSIYLEIAHPTGIERIGLRYINQIEIPGTKIEITRFLHGCPESYIKLFLSTEFPFEAEGENLLMILAHAPHHEDDFTRFFLDFDYGTPALTSMTPAELDQILERAHSRIEQTFEASITDESRRLFGETKRPAHYQETPEQAATGAVREVQARYGAPTTTIPSFTYGFSQVITPNESVAMKKATASIVTSNIVAFYNDRLQKLWEQIAEWKSAEEREAERWEQLEMEMGVEQDIVFKAPDIPKRKIEAIVHNRGRTPVPPFFYDPVEE